MSRLIHLNSITIMADFILWKLLSIFLHNWIHLIIFSFLSNCLSRWALVFAVISHLVCSSLFSLPQIRYRKDKVRSKLTPTFPLVYTVKDLANGCAIASMLHYYCSGLLALEGKTPAHKNAWEKLTIKCSISFFVLISWDKNVNTF